MYVQDGIKFFTIILVDLLCVKRKIELYRGEVDEKKKTMNCVHDNLKQTIHKHR